MWECNKAGKHQNISKWLENSVIPILVESEVQTIWFLIYLYDPPPALADHGCIGLNPDEVVVVLDFDVVAVDDGFVAYFVVADVVWFILSFAGFGSDGFFFNNSRWSSNASLAFWFRISCWRNRAWCISSSRLLRALNVLFLSVLLPEVPNATPEARDLILWTVRKLMYEVFDVEELCTNTTNHATDKSIKGTYIDLWPHISIVSIRRYTKNSTAVVRYHSWEDVQYHLELRTPYHKYTIFTFSVSLNELCIGDFLCWSELMSYWSEWNKRKSILFVLNARHTRKPFYTRFTCPYIQTFRYCAWICVLV